MTLRGCDAMGILDGVRVAATGLQFALRYVGIPSNPKCIRRAELGSLLDAGVRVGFVFESWAGRAMEGYEAGQADARAVENYLLYDLAIPYGPLVFYAVDEDVSFDQVRAYFEGVASIRRGGAYGSYRVISGLLDNNLVTEVWQTAGWSHGVVDVRASVYQTGEQGTFPNGTKFDLDTAPGYGAWTYPEVDMALSDDDAKKVKDAIMNEPIQMLGSDENDKVFPEGKFTSLRSIVQWFDNDVLGVRRAVLPVLNEILAELKTLNARPAAGTVQLSPADLETVSDNVADKLREDMLDALSKVLGPPTPPAPAQGQ